MMMMMMMTLRLHYLYADHALRVKCDIEHALPGSANYLSSLPLVSK